MNHVKQIIIVFFFCIWSVCSVAQSALTVLTAGNDSPVNGAIVVLKPIDESAGKKPEILFTNNDGVVLNTVSLSSSVLIHCFGYLDFSDTIKPGQSYIFRMTRQEVNLNEVVVTGQYDINTSDKSVYNVKVIDAKTIQQQGAQNLTDVLSNQLTARLSQDNILGSNVQIDGVSGQNIKILIDGVPMIGRENGNIDLSQVNLNNVERIEIIEGPMSVSYGTDALGGLINIVTKKTSSYPLEADLHFYYESVGTYNGDATLFLKRNNHSLSVSAGRDFFSGFSVTDTSRFQEWKPKEQYFGTINYNYSKKFFNLGIKSEYYNEEIQNKGNPVVTPYQAYAFDDYYFTRRLNQSLFAEWRLKNNAKLQFTNAYNNYRRIKNTFRKDLVTLNQELSTGTGSQDTSIFDQWTLRGTYSSVLPARKINFQAGYDINLQSGSGESLAQGIQHLNDYAAFGSLEYEIFKNFYLRPGLRFAYNSRYGAPFTPSLNLKYDFLNRYTLRGSYAKGFRSPTLKELDLQFVDVNHNIHGNDSLKAESSDNFSIALTMRNKIGPNNLKTEVSFFMNNITNIITLALIDFSTQYYTYVNLDRYKTRGATFTADFSMKHVSVSSGFSLLALYNTLSDTFTVDKYSLTPEFKGNISYSMTKVGLEGAIFFKSTGSTPGYNLDAQGNVFQTFLQSYSIMDASLTKYLGKKHAAISCGVKNIFNVTDLQSNQVGQSYHSGDSNSVAYGIGRIFFASVQLKLFRD
jgi:outer membrane receptor for ferrienterochelin and colicins